ncbi:MAG: sialate O-acetylesterase [Verrucomicrobiota bacterium]
MERCYLIATAGVIGLFLTGCGRPIGGGEKLQKDASAELLAEGELAASELRAAAKGSGLRVANLLGAGTAPISEAGTFRVYLLMGQSNMVGLGRARDLPAEWREPHPRVRVWANEEWQFMKPSRSFGPEVAFTRELVEAFPEDTIGVIKIAVSGTGLAAWSPNYDPKLAKLTADSIKGSLYGDLLNAVEGARASSDFVWGGLLWKQGGKDARRSDLSDTYGVRFQRMVGRLRLDLDEPSLPIYVLTYFDEAGIEENRRAIERIRPDSIPLFQFQAQVDEFIPNCWPVFHGQLPTVIDQVHFNSEGQIKLGKLAAEAVLTLRPESAGEDGEGDPSDETGEGVDAGAVDSGAVVRSSSDPG